MGAKHVRRKPAKAKPIRSDAGERRDLQATRNAAKRALESIAKRKATFPKVVGADRVEIARVALITGADDSESTRRKGWDAEELLDRIPDASNLPTGKPRRVLVRAFAWLVHDEDEEVYDPQWITLIAKTSRDGNSLRQAFRNAREWLDRYTTELQFQVASKLLLFTKLEVAMWRRDQPITASIKPRTKAKTKPKSKPKRKARAKTKSKRKGKR